MDSTIIAAIIGAVAVIAVGAIGKLRKKKKKPKPSIEALKLGYSLVELSRFARAKRLSIVDDSPQRSLYDSTVAKVNILRKALGLVSSIPLSYDNHADNVIFSHYSILLEGFNRKVQHSFEIGKITGNILLNMLPDYLAFTIQGEPRVEQFLTMADNNCNKISDQWRSLFDNHQSGMIKEVKEEIKILKSTRTPPPLDSFVIKCEEMAKQIFAEFEKQVEQLA